MDFQEFTEEWESKAANIEADLDYDRHLDEHYLAVETMLSKLRTLMQAAEWLGETDLSHWRLLGFQMHEFRNTLFAKIEMFNPNIIQQLGALSKGTIKTEALYNVTLANHSPISEKDYLEKLRQRFNILDAFITADRTLIILFSDYQPNTLPATANAFGRGLENAGLDVKRILFYGAPIFDKPLDYPSS